MTFDAAMEQLERTHPIGELPTTFSITLGTEGLCLPRHEAHDSRPIHFANDRKIEGRVNTPTPRPRRWTHIRVPVELAERLTVLAGEMLIAHGEGRISLPNSMAEYVPAYHVIVKALDEQEARRERSARPRARRPR